MTDSTDNARGPERIWFNDARPSEHRYVSRSQFAGGIEYIRADLAPDPLADPRVVALVEALRNIAVVGYSDDPAVSASIARQVVGQARAALAALSPAGGNYE